MFPNGISHHAYLIEGNSEEILPELFDSIKKAFGVEMQGNPDFSFERFDSFTIDDGRRLKEMQSNKAFSVTQKIFVMSMNSMTREAQNSLLKVFEEPTADTHFFIVIPSAQNILPTLRSRLVVLTHESRSKILSRDDARRFILSSPKNRLTMIKALVDVDPEDRGEMRAKAFALLESILVLKHEGVNIAEADKKTILFLKNITGGLSYLSDKSSSPKLILEQIALSL